MGKPKARGPRSSIKGPSTSNSKVKKPDTLKHAASKRTRHEGPPPSIIIPFHSSDCILLVGEGDYSFSHALLQSHNCANLICTSFDDRPTVLSKYPQASAHLDSLESETGIKTLFGVDATKLAKSGVGIASGGKDVKRLLGRVDKVVFNFPHTGGLTKDVQRQIRANQDLLKGFLQAAVPLLATPGREKENDGGENEDGDEGVNKGSESRHTGGAIVITLFEGEPYSQWDLRGLARQAGLQVERSFRFVAAAYPGYSHARTLGNIQNGGGWKGEDRPARTYVLRPREAMQASGGARKSKKRKRTGSESDSDD